METLERFFFQGGWVQPGDNPTHRQTSTDRWQWLFFLSVDSHDNNKIDNSSVNIQSHSRSLCSSNETGHWEQLRATMRLQHAFNIQNNFLWSITTLLCQWNYLKKESKMEKTRTMAYATLHVTNFIRQCLFDGSKDTTEVLYTEAETRSDVSPFLIIPLSLNAKPRLQLKYKTTALMLWFLCWLLSVVL